MSERDGRLGTAGEAFAIGCGDLVMKIKDIHNHWVTEIAASGAPARRDGSAVCTAAARDCLTSVCIVDD